jgi:replicative DNA helicase
MSYDSGNFDRIPPSSLEAERALLGSLLVDRTMFERVAEVVKVPYFYADLHQTIYQAMHGLYERKEPHFDIVAVGEELRSRGMLDKIGGAAYLSELMDAVPTASSVDYYARIVRDRAAQRAMIELSGKAREVGYDCDDNVPGGISRVESWFKTLGERFSTGVVRPASMVEIGEKRKRKLLESPAFVLPPPWKSVQRAIGGFRPELNVWSAAAKQGKSHAMLQLALYDAEHNGDVIVVAAELGDVDTKEILVEMLSGVRIVRQQMGNLTALEHEKVAEARDWLDRGFTSGAIEVLDKELHLTSRQIAAEIAVHAERCSARGGRLASVIVDVIGELPDVLADLDVEHGLRRKERIKHERQELALKTLRDAAKRVGVPVHAVMHQNRNQGVKKPTEATIRDGGNAGATAANVIHFWRPDPDGDPENGVMIVELARFGDPTTIPMRYVRGLWLDARAKQDREWFEPGAPLQTEFAPAGRREFAGEVDGQPARIVSGYDRPITQQEVDRIAFPSEYGGDDDDLVGYARERLGDDDLDPSIMFGQP